MIQIRLMFFVICCVLLIAGCSEVPHGLVQGTVTKGGKPLPKVKVVFLAEYSTGTKAPFTSAYTDEYGKFTLSTVKGNEGAVVGHYRVTFDDILGGTTPRVPKRYRHANLTPYKNVEVKAGEQSIDFELD